MSYNGPSRDYGPNWNRRRWAIFAAVGYRCQICGICKRKFATPS